jgi:hypothetical protein
MRSPPIRPTCWRLGLAVALAAAGAGPDPSAPALNQELAVVAEAIKQLLDGRGQDAIAVGAFTGPERATANGGNGIKHALTEELKRVGVRVEKRADLEIKGDYFDAEDQQAKLVVLVLKARVIDRQGTEIALFQRSLFDVATLAALLGPTLQLPPVADEPARDRSLRKGLDHPQCAIEGARISAPGSPYAVEVLVKSRGEYQPRPAQRLDDLAFVPIKREEVYAIALINNSPYDTAVTPTIDGLSVFAFSQVKNGKTGRPKYTHFVVPAHGSGTVPGWHIHDDVNDPRGNTDSFQITAYAKSAAAELNSTGDVGVITATFAAAWPKGSPPPADEPDAATRDFGRSGDATGRGPRIGVAYTPVERELGRVRATISVRYTK